jgi:hypothetical protein
LVQAFLKKWWVESDFKAPNLPLSLRFKGSKVPNYYTVVFTRRTNVLHNIMASPQSSIDDPETQVTMDTTQITKKKAE